MLRYDQMARLATDSYYLLHSITLEKLNVKESSGMTTSLPHTPTYDISEENLNTYIEQKKRLKIRQNRPYNKIVGIIYIKITTFTIIFIIGTYVIFKGKNT